MGVDAVCVCKCISDTDELAQHGVSRVGDQACRHKARQAKQDTTFCRSSCGVALRVQKDRGTLVL